WLPGGVRSTEQVPPSAALVDAALDVFRRLDGDVGPRVGSSPAGGIGRRGGPGLDPAWRPTRWPWGHSGLPLSRPPRSRHQPRGAADLGVAPGAVRLTHHI